MNYIHGKKKGTPGVENLTLGVRKKNEQDSSWILRGLLMVGISMTS